MARSRRSKNWLTSKPRLVIAIGVIVFLVLDVLLIGYALTQAQPDGQIRQPLPVPTFGTTPTPTPTPTPTAEPLPGAAPRFLVSVDGTAGWRSTAGACPGNAAVIERTVDGGRTWEPTPIDVLTVHEVLALNSDSASDVQAVARVEGDCSVDLLASYTEGTFWNRYPDRVTEAAYIDPTNPSVLHLRGDPVAAPCAAPHELRNGAGSVVVICDSTLFELVDGSADWATLPVPGVLAVAPNDAGYTIAVAGVESCPGVSIQTLAPLAAGGTPVGASCVPDAALSEVTLAQSGATVWLWAGDRVWISGDGGVTWA